MEPSERTLLQADTTDNYSLYITSIRIFFKLETDPKKKNLKGNLAYGASVVAIGGALGAAGGPLSAVFMGNKADKDKMRQEELKGVSILYNDFDWISLNKSRNGGDLVLRTKKIWKTFKLDKEQFAKISEVLQSITQLNGKVNIH